MRRLLLIGLFVAGLFLLMGIAGGRSYPDGPFSVQLSVEGRAIPAGNEITLSSSTQVTEYHTAGAYTKSPGATSWDGFSVVAPADSNLDSWFAAGGEKDIYLRILDGRGRLIEAWMLFRCSPLSREPAGDSIRYSFRTTSLFERDRMVVTPG